jgi:hypothetical protein
VEDLNNTIMLVFALFAVWIVAPGVVADIKGYPPDRCWMACGVIGVVVLAFVPRIKPDDNAAARHRAAAQAWSTVLTFLQLCGFVVALFWISISKKPASGLP